MYSMFAIVPQWRILEDRKVKSDNLTSLRSSRTTGIVVKKGKTQFWHTLCKKLTDFPKHVPTNVEKDLFNHCWTSTLQTFFITYNE